MAGGEGSRLRPLTCDRPKPMVPVMNVPIMEHIIKLLKKHGFRDIAVTLQYLPEQIKDYFGSGGRLGVRLHYYTEDTPLGTAGSVKNAEPFLDETFLVISGDALTDIDLEEAMKFHQKKGSLATLVLTRQESPLEYGVVITDAKGKITRFLEKPAWSEVFSDTVNTGIYVLEPAVFRYIEAEAKFDFSKDLFPLLMEKGHDLFGYISPGYWCDIGNLEQYHQAHVDFLGGKVGLSLVEKEFEPGIWLGEGAVIEKGARIEAPVVIGAGCRLRKGAVVKDFSVLGQNTLVEGDASIKRSITWKGCYLGRRVELRGSVLCRGVQVQAAASLYEGTVVGDDSIIEENCRIKPHVKIWPCKRVEGGTCLSASLVWGSRAGRSLFGRDGITGTVNLDLTPEMGARLGAAFGSLLKEGSSLVLGHDNCRSSRMVKEALAAGLLSAGVRVLDLGQVVAPVARQAVLHRKARGGLHVQTEETEGVSRLKFFDERGINLSRGMERKLEQAFHREDFRRLRGSDIGESVRVLDNMPRYFQDLMTSLDRESFREAGFKLLWLYPTPYLYGYLAPFLQELNCQVVTLASPGNPVDAGEALRQAREDIVDKMRGCQSQLAFHMDGNGENLALFDHQGRLVADEMFTVLVSLLLFQARQGKKVVVPITTPSAVDKLAGRYQGEVFRTKTALSTLMEEAAPDQFLLTFDAIASLVRILEFCARSRKSLGDLVDTIPSYYMQKKQTPCPWKDKGRVMRRLIEDTRAGAVELLDGIKVHHPEGWALVLPDPEKPFYQVYSEAYSEEIAESLTDLYINKIKDIQKQEN
jgi:mannose-1-phosphate guanylyltransferase / phosphomannomutase